jgi:DNA-binding winged helix-turn-helix (wHTH) protein/serine/threonine protein kinase
MEYTAPISARHWSFGDWEFDELARELRFQGKAVELESKPLDVLSQLLLHAGEVVTKSELIEAVWPDTATVDGSLTTAISKLRRVFGEGHYIIVTVPRVGYRLAIPVHLRVTSASTRVDLGFRIGNAVPGREQWRFSRSLEVSGASEVWLAENPKTRETRVFKFAADGVHLKGLKREVTVSRFLRDSLGERREFVPVLEWNFETAPYFLESEYAGANLTEWAEGLGGLENIPMSTRLQVLIEIAEAVAAAHSVGVLHKDLKPGNLLVSSRDGGLQIRVADFGSSALTEPTRLEELGITNIGFTRDGNSQPDPLTGTLMYLAPEVLSGHVPGVSADVYALGVILYQLVAGDFRKPLSPGWEAGIADPLLCADIADAACGDPVRRMNSAATLAYRLRNLGFRRAKQNDADLFEERARRAERRLADARTRRPWIAAAAAALTLGAALSVVLYFRAARDRNQAERQTAIAAAINRFLSDDLLGRSDPFQSGRSDESFTDVVGRASPRIDLQFGNEPLVAARLHQTIARALDSRTDYVNARREYEQAAKLFSYAEGDPQDRVIVELQRAAMEARTYEKGSLPLAKAFLAREEAEISRLKQPRGDLRVWLASARGMIALIDNDAKAAVKNFQSAADQADTVPEFDETARLTLKQRLAFACIRLGDGMRAEKLARELIGAFSRSGGPTSPHVLRVRLTLAQSFMIQGKHQDVIHEVDGIYPEFVSRLGPDHELSMQLLTTRAQSEGSLGLWDRAVRDDLAIHDLAVQKQGPLSFFAIATQSDAALAQCRAEKYTAGTLNARKSFEDSVRSFGPRAGLTGGAAYTLATCLIGLGQLKGAEELLSNIDIPAVAQLAGVPDWGANVVLAQAQIAYLRKNYEASRESVRKAAAAFLREGAEPYQKHALETLAAALKVPGV